MKSLTALIPLALLGVSTTASATELDSDTSIGLVDLHVDVADYRVQERKQSRSRSTTRSNGNKTVKSRTVRDKNGNTMQRRGATNGQQSARGQRGHASRNAQNSTAVHGANNTTTTTDGITQDRWRSHGQFNDGRGNTADRFAGKERTREGVRTEIDDGNGSPRVFSEGSATWTERGFGQGNRANGDTITRRGEGNLDRTVSRTPTRTTVNDNHIRTQSRTTVRDGDSRTDTRSRTGTTTRTPTRGQPATRAPVRTPTRTTTRTTTVRPSTSHPHTNRGHARPGTRTVHTSVRARPARGHHRTVHYTHVRPYHGVFVMGPSPSHHHRYDGSPNNGHRVDKGHMPTREIDRAGSLAIGLEAGMVYGDYLDGYGYSDMGLGISGRYRPEEAVGIELELSHFNQTWDAGSDRAQTSVAGSVELFAFPWTRVSPYGLVGLTWTDRDIDDAFATYDGGTVTRNDAMFGPHGGLGLEFALGENVALDLEARYTGYLNREVTDPTFPGVLSTTGAVMFHF